jgi:hypothetical protein
MIKPTLRLDFASGWIDPRFTHTRAGTATYFDRMGVLRTAATGTPRLDHNPTTGEPVGLRSETARYNRCMRSAEFDNATWIRVNTNVAANGWISPEGLLNADSLIATTTNGVHTTEQDVTIVANLYHTYSIFLRPGTSTTPGTVMSALGSYPAAKLRFGNTGATSYFEATFDLTGRAVVGVVAAGSASEATARITPIKNSDWSLCEISGKVDASSTVGRMSIFILNMDQDVSFAGDNSSGIGVWGGQLEQFKSRSSYNATTTALVTRPADVFTTTDLSFLHKNYSPAPLWFRGTVVVHVQGRSAFDSLEQILWGVSDGTSNNYLRLRIIDDTGQPQFVGRANAATIVQTGDVYRFSPGEEVDIKIAAGWEMSTHGTTKSWGQKITTSKSGGVVIATSGSDMMVDPTRFDVGEYNSSASMARDLAIKSLHYYPAMLTDDEMRLAVGL